MSTKGWGRFLVGVGLCATLAANVAHAYREGGTEGPSGLALGFAAVWPLGLLGCSEVLFRTAFEAARDYVTAVAVAAVGLGAGFISFGHSQALLASELGESKLAGVLGAIAIDGLLVVGGLTLYGESRRAVPLARAVQAPVPVRASVPSAHVTVPPAVPAVQEARPVPAQVAQEVAQVPVSPRVPAAQVAQSPVPPAVPAAQSPAVPAVQPVPAQPVPAAQPVPPVPVAQAVHLHAVQGDPVHELKAQGKSVRAIAEELSISPSTVQRRLKQSA
jgi:hypothetical protein